jgi:hypothetical protein
MIHALFNSDIEAIVLNPIVHWHPLKIENWAICRGFLPPVSGFHDPFYNLAVISVSYIIFIIGILFPGNLGHFCRTWGYISWWNSVLVELSRLKTPWPTFVNVLSSVFLILLIMELWTWLVGNYSEKLISFFCASLCAHSFLVLLV